MRGPPRLPDPPPGVNVGLPTQAQVERIQDGIRRSFLFPMLGLIVLFYGTFAALVATGVIPDKETVAIPLRTGTK